MKQIVLSLFLFLSLSLQAQTERRDTLMSDSLQTDSVIPAKPSAFKRAIRKFMNFSDFDTLYISHNRYNYALMTTHFSNFEYYSVTSNLPQPQKLSFSPNPHNKIGLYFGWRWIFLGWSVDVDDIYRKTNRRNKGTEFDLSLYSSKLGVDIFYRRTGNNYKIHKINGFPEDVPANYSEKFNGIKVDIKGLNLYYIFNNRKFSYPAAFSQSTNQRRNAGSFIAGFSISKHNLEFDYAELPDFILEAMNPAMKVNNIKYTNANISFGYAYNWVFARNCLACLSLTPAIAYKASDVDAETHEGKTWYGNFNLDFLIRAGVVYNNGKYFVGTSFVGKNYNYHRNNFSLDNGFGTLQIYVGFNFNLCKESVLPLEEDMFVDIHHLSGKGATFYSDVFGNMMINQDAERRSRNFYNTIDEKMSSLPQQIFGIVLEENKNNPGQYEIRAVANYNVDAEYRITMVDENGEELRVIQEYSGHNILSLEETEEKTYKIEVREKGQSIPAREGTITLS